MRRRIFQFFLLMWKNLTVHRRNLSATFYECFLPTLFAIVILVLKLLSNNERMPKHVFEQRPIGFPIFPAKFGYVPDSPLIQNIANDTIRRHLEYVQHVSPADLQRWRDEGLQDSKQLKSKDRDKRKTQGKNIPIGIGFKTFKQAEKYFKKNSKTFNYVLEFKNVNETDISLPKNLSLVIHPYRKEGQVWHTKWAYEPIFKREPRIDFGDQGFAYVEMLLSRSIIASWLAARGQNMTDADFPLEQKRFPVDPFNTNAMDTTMRLQLTLFVVLSFMMSVFIVIKNVVSEKENKIKESMRLMGMDLFVFWLSWYVTCVIFIMPAVGAFTLVFHCDFKGDGALLGHSDPSITFVIYMCYACCVVSYSLVICCIVNKGNEGAIIGGVIFLALYVPYELVVARFWEVKRISKLFFSFSFNVAMGLANHLTVRRETRMEGVQWSNLHDNINDNLDNYTHMDSIWMLVSNMLVHFVLVWYLDNVFPGEYGVPKSYFFFLTKAYWCGQSRDPPEASKLTSLSQQNHSVFFEKEPSNLRPGVAIKGLRKVFGNKVSVSNVTLNMYEGQITVLLGHNGAGKTTTMSMLTGFIPPTKGTALVNGYDICTNIEGVRKSLALCPQHDILFDVLTVAEHLWFYAKLKGDDTNTLQEEINTMIKDIGLESKARTRVSMISGGQKRSVSVGISLMGKSKVVFLDEPSSGMDPSTRRLTWDLLQKNCKGRTMLLSTHYMDEADTLANRIAILVEGKLQCCGTPLFLKKLYGAGYHLVIEKSTRCNVKHLVTAVQSKIPTALIESAQMFEVSFLLPDNETQRFPDLFRYLSTNKEVLGITGFGISATTMEEVFLKSELLVDEQKLSQSSELRSSTTMMHEEDINIEHFDNLNRDITAMTGYSLKYSQFEAQVKKRFLVVLRHWPITCILYLIPAFLVFLNFSIETSLAPMYDMNTDGLFLNLSLYHERDPVSVYMFTVGSGGSDSGALDAQFMTQYKDAVTSNGGKIVNTEKEKVQSLDDLLLAEQRKIGRAAYDRTHPLGVIFNTSGMTVALYNGQPYHTLFVSINVIMNTVARTLLGDSSYDLRLGLNPLPKEGELELMLKMYKSHRTSFLKGLFIGIGYAIYSATAVHFVLWERQSGVKHMHAISGVSMTMYWLPTFIWDVCSFIVPTIVVFGLTYICGNHKFMLDYNWLLCILAITMFVWAAVPHVYAMQFLFESVASGAAGIVVWNLFSVLLLNIVVFELTMPEADTIHIGKLVKILAIVFSPGFNLSECYRTITMNYLRQKHCKSRLAECSDDVHSLCCINHPDLCYSSLNDEKCYRWSDTSMDLDVDIGIGWSLIALTVQGILAWIVVAMIEFGLFQKLRNARNKSSNIVDVSTQQDTRSSFVIENDVAAERERVSTMTSQLKKDLKTADPLLLVNLNKRYGHLKAVDRLSVGVTKSECFGLLGPSGSGKSTVFRMTTGQTRVNQGNAFFHGFDVRTQLRAAQQQIGYCPQSDAHIGELTAIETLQLYGRLRGIPNKDLDMLIKALIKITLLYQHAHRRCGNYSGGNRRKLSLAMALIGNPAFLFLDEPSCGMDPKARRQMWDVLCKIRASGRTLFISSHSMEECDALCTKLGILLKGRLMCLGSPQHLKKKYGQGYTLVVKMGTSQDGDMARTDKITEFVQKEYLDTTVFDDHQGYIHLQIKDPKADLAGVFSVMERCRSQLEVEDYAVNETSLEQVFLMFTMIQRQDTETQPQSCWFLQSGFFGDNFCP